MKTDVQAAVVQEMDRLRTNLESPAVLDCLRGGEFLTAPSNRPRAEAAIRRLYREAGLPEPRILWKEDPFEAATEAIRLAGGFDPLDAAERAGGIHSKITPSDRDDLERKTAFSTLATDLESRLRRDWPLLSFYFRTSRGTARDLLESLRMGTTSETVAPADSRAVSQGDPESRGLIPEPALSRDWPFGPTVGPGGRLAMAGVIASDFYGTYRRIDSMQRLLDWLVGRRISEVQHQFRLESQSHHWFRARGGISMRVQESHFNTGERGTEWIAAFGSGQPVESGQPNPWRELLCSAGMFWPLGDACVVSERPTKVCFDSVARLHAADGLALRYPSGWEVYSLHGVPLAKHHVLHPETITSEEIEQEANVEARRLLIERYGQERYLKDTGAREIHRDDFGVLYRKVTGVREPLVLVKVLNATPEPDGSFKDYFLRVPPEMRTARQAVAWTFGKTETEYDPDCES